MFKSHYSFRKATGTPDEVCSRLKELGYKYAPLADIENTFALMEWKRACEKYDLKPIYGVSLAVTESTNAKKVSYDYFTFYAKDNLKDLNDVISLAYENGKSLPRVGFIPLIRYDQLDSELFSKLFVVCGRKANPSLIPEKDNIFIGVSPSCNSGWFNYCKTRNNQTFAMVDSWFVNEDDKQFYEVYAGINADVKTFPQHILSEDEWKSKLTHIATPEEIQQSIDNRNKAFAQCNIEIKSGDLLRPKSEKTLRELCIEGSKEKGIDLSDPVYSERFDMELKVIGDKGFDDYFFIVSDLVSWAKGRMMVGPGRGSSAGSLVCFLLDITDVDPIKYGLLFFRFLDPSRGGWKFKRDWVGFEEV